MTARERVMQALSFQPTDRVPMDLGGMASTGISCFAYPKLVAALGLPPRRPRVHDASQMLALPDLDVLDALDCDVVAINWGVTNAFEEPEKWHEYDFGGRLQARVQQPEDFVVLPDGTIEQPRAQMKMPPASFVFDAEHGGQALDALEQEELPLLDLKKFREDLAAALPGPTAIRETAELCQRVRASTDRAVFFTGNVRTSMSIMGHGGVGIFPVICLLRPDYAAAYHEILTEHVLAKMELLLPEIGRSIDVIMLSADDWGTQQSTIASPRTFKELFLPYYRQLNDAVHRLAPEVKTFLHSCGAIYDILDDIIAAGFDILNPVQWTAGGHSYQAWKDKCRNRISLWGGGVSSQQTLAHGLVAEVTQEVSEIVPYLAQDGGFIFNAIHNLLAEVAPEKVIAMYRTAAQARSQ